MKEEISFKDFQKLDIAIGTVTKAEVPEWSHWVMKLTVDFGNEIGKRIIFAGIMKYYKPEEINGKQFPFVINMKPKRIGPANEEGEYEYSQGMMMAASLEVEGAHEGETKAVLFSLSEKVPAGARVS